MAWPADPQDLHVELAIGALGAWVDVVDKVRARARIVIDSGQRNEQAEVTASSCTFELEDPQGDFNEHNPESPYFGVLGRNVSMRVRIGSDVRFVGEIPEFTPRADKTGRDVVIPIVANGPLRRLEQGSRNVRSAIRRYVEWYSPQPVQYWALEDASGSTVAEAVIGPKGPMTPGSFAIDGPGIAFGVATTRVQPEYTGYEIVDIATSPLPSFAQGGSLSGEFPVGTGDVEWTMQFIGQIDATDGANQDVVSVSWAVDSGTYSHYEIIQRDVSGITDLVAYDRITGAASILCNTSAWMLDMSMYHVQVWQDGANVETEFVVSRITTNGTVTSSDTDSRVATAGWPYVVTINPDNAVIDTTQSLSESNNIFSDLIVGHLGLWHTTAAPGYTDTAIDSVSPKIYSQWFGHAGESAKWRIIRIGAEEGIGVDADDNETENAGVIMGFQRPMRPMEIIRQCIAVDQGVLYEPRDFAVLGYRRAQDLYNQMPKLTLSYSDKVFSDQITPTSDDAPLWNWVTVVREGGSSRTLKLEDGKLSIQDPPNGVGIYDRGPRMVNMHNDNQLTTIAGWYLHNGTWNDQRYPSLKIELHRAPWLADTTASTAAKAIVPGDLIAITNLPSWARSVDNMSLLMVRGYQEIISRYEHSIKWVCTPGWPWEVEEVETGGSTLVNAPGSAGTSLVVATSAGPAWSTSDEPYHLLVDGEVMTATGVALDTPAFIAAGAAAHGNNASVAPALPAGITADAGQLLLCLAAIRNSGTGTVDLPSGWTSLANFGNMRLFGRYYATGVTAPTVTFTGGVANADTSAQLAAFSGLSLELDSGRYGASDPSPQTLLNSSAANIAYPSLSVRRDNCVVIFAGWKQDDWTSVATVGDAEIGEPDTTTGDDQGIVWDYDIQTTATNITAGSWTVTGGASAISRAIVVALRPTQTITVTRSINDVTNAPSIGDAVTGWRLGVIAL